MGNPKLDTSPDSEDRAVHGGNSYDPGLESHGHNLDEFSDINVTKLLAKIDLRLIPSLSIMYLLAFLDRTNIANAAVYGLREDLGIAAQSNDYNTALVLFFIPYILLEIPSNVLLKKLKPHVWLPLCMMAFGLVTVCQGLVVNKAGLYATRFMLGVAETGMFPGAFYLIGMWYKRTEAQKRFSFFFSSTSLAGAFGGLIAAGINRLDGALGHRAWRWIFIIEGAITMFFAVVLYFGIPDFPENAKFLTEKERRFVTARLVEEQGGSGHGRKTTFKDVVGVFKDYKIVVGGFMYFGLIVPAYGYAYFAPTIIQTFKYSPVQTQLHSVPPWAAAFGWSMILAWFSDRARHRYGFIMFSMCLAIVGFGLMLSTSVSNAVKYAALHLLTSGVYGSMPIIVCWFNLNLGGHLRRSVGSAWQVGFGNIGGIIATYSFLAKDKPRYIPGFSISLAFVGLAFISCTIYFFGILRENKRKDSTTSHMTEHEKQELGDLSPDYRYMY